MLGFRVYTVLLLGGVLILGGGVVSRVQAQASSVCERVLPSADDHYVNGDYEEALRFVTACLNQGERTSAQAVEAYRLLALIHLRQDELDQARSAVVNLLGVDPTYTADPVNSPPSYVSLVAIVQRDLQGQEDAEAVRPPFFRRTSTWLTMSGILVGSGVATYFAVGSGADSGGGGGTGPPPGPGSLPIPPGTPN